MFYQYQWGGELQFDRGVPDVTVMEVRFVVCFERAGKSSNLLRSAGSFAVI